MSVCAFASMSFSTQAITPGKLAGGLPPEVRIRKLHLVRPDLILYPIEYEVYC